MISLEKGSKINLTKGTGLTKFYFGLGWDEPQTQGGDEYDCDVSAILLNGDGKILNGDDKNFVYYGLAANSGDPFQHHTGCIRHTGDNLTGKGAGDDEILIVDVSKIPADCEEISIIITIHEAIKRNQNFGAIKNTQINIHPAGDDDKPIKGDPNVDAKYELSEDYSMFTAMQVASVYRKDGEWKFDAIGQGFKADLRGVLTQYGA